MENYELVSEWGSIYKYGNHAIKIYSDDTPYEYVAEKARIHSLLHAAGLPVPFYYGVQKLSEDKIALEMDYIENKPFMRDEMSRDEREKALDIQANLQCKINAVDASSFGLPEFSTQLAHEIKRTPYLPEQIKDKVFDLLSGLDTRLLRPARRLTDSRR